MISFIISVYDRTEMLRACLASLDVQDGNNQQIVCCNSCETHAIEKAKAVCGDNATLRTTGLVGARSCYESADWVKSEASNPWVCFPSDDSLYVQGFSRIMLQTANLHAADLVYCDCVYRQDKAAGNWPEYTTLETEPRMGKIDKTCFILRRELFRGFPPHPKGWSDGALIEQLVAQGVRHAKAPGCLVVHQ